MVHTAVCMTSMIHNMPFYRALIAFRERSPPRRVDRGLKIIQANQTTNEIPWFGMNFASQGRVTVCLFQGSQIMQSQILTKEIVQQRVVSPLLHDGWLTSLPGAGLQEELSSLDRPDVTLGEARAVINRLEERIRQLENMAMSDELTGLLNRRGFSLALQRELSMARRDSTASGVLIMVDLDGFKSINDLWGHSVGDDYLQSVAHALLGNVRNTDIVARLGGDEFVILFTRMDEDAGIRRMAKLEKDFNSRMMQWGDKILPLRASFGLSPYTGNDTPEVILASADRRLYANKAARQVKMR